MTELKRHKLAWKILAIPVSATVSLILNYRYEKITGVEGPYLLLVNHNMELDPCLAGMAAGRQIYFVASEHITRKGFGGWFLKRYFKPIIHTKGRAGIQSVMGIMRTLKSGESVCLFPEGNRSFNGLTGDIAPATAKLARKTGASLVTYRIEGGYLTQPRWSLKLRRGKTNGRLVHVYAPEELKKMTDTEVYNAICTDLYEDAYATQEKARIAFKGKKLAEGMESTVFLCPACSAIGTLRSSGKTVSCPCGFSAEYDEYGYLHTADGHTLTITECDRLQRSRIESLLNEDTAVPLFSDEVRVLHIGDDHKVIEEFSGTLTAYSDRATLNEKTVPFTDVEGIAIFSRNDLTVHIGKQLEQYEIRSGLSFSALKYMYLYNAWKEQNGKKSE